MGLWERIQIWTTTCSADTELQNLKDALEKSEKSMQIAELTSEFLSKNPNAGQNFRKAREGLGKVSEGLSKAENVCKDINALKRIHEGIKVLSNESVIYKDPEKAAEAFGNIFGGFGRLASYLPPPADSYGQILEEAGNGFFGNVSKAIIPSLRYKGTPYEQLMR